jgi:hypothetical protein
MRNMPDVALTANDISLPGKTINHSQSVDINCTIHNIGNVTAKNILVEFLVDNKKIKDTRIPQLEAPNDLVPRHTKINFNWMPEAGRHRIEIKLSIDQKEITTWNNKAIYDVTVQ